MELIFYSNFSKKVNSTKRPSGGVTYDVKLKQGTSVENPTFLISGINLDVNYCKWNNHYYFVRDIVLGNNNIYEVQCTQDLLATFKGNVTAYVGYVEYCDSVWNKWIPDRRLTMTNEIEVVSNEAPAFNSDTDGTIILTVAGTNDNAQVGFTTMYAISKANAGNFADWMYDDSVWAQIKAMFDDPYSAIIESHWVPWDIATTGDTIYIGNDASTVTAKGLSASMSSSGSTYSITIPWNTNDWRDFAPYAVMELYLPFYGTVTIDQSKLKDQTSISINVIKDPISGEVIYLLKSGTWIATYKCDASVPLAIGQTTGQKPTAIGQILAGTGAIIGGAAAVATGGASVAAVGTVAGGVASVGLGAFTYFQEESSGRGGNGGFASGNAILKSDLSSSVRRIKLTLYSHKFSALSVYDLEDIEGLPIFQRMPLGTLTGFVKCAGASISIDGFAEDREQLNQYINQGFYIE